MKIIIAAALTLAVFVALHINTLKKKKGIILAAYAFGMILLFVVYNTRTLDHILSFYRPVTQSVYQKEFLEKGEYPDAFLDEFFKGKKVYTPNDQYDTDDGGVGEKANRLSEELGYYWLYFYFHSVNMWNYLDLCGADVVKDDALNGIILTKEQRSYFDDAGAANDMLRYTFGLTPYEDEIGNGFYYYWFYNSYIGPSRVYICTEDLADTDETVVLWQPVENEESEDYFIMSKSFYDRVIAK